MKRVYKERTVSFKCCICESDFSYPSPYVAHRRRNSLSDPKYCSRKCMGIGQRTIISKRLIIDNSCPVTESGCWIWMGGIWTDTGYGRINSSASGKAEAIGAHRASYLAFKGRIKKGHVVRHACDNPLCVNPDHLATGTAHQNKMDSVWRRRHAHGSTMWNAVLSENDVPVIRGKLSAGASQSEVAREFNVSHGVIWRIAHNIAWRHV